MRIILFGLMLVGFLILALIFVIIAMREEEKKEQKKTHESISLQVRY